MSVWKKKRLVVEMTDYLFDVGIEEEVPHVHVLVDFANLFFRSYHAYMRLNEGLEFPVSHLYGSFKILSSILKRVPGDFSLHFALEGYPKHRYKLLPCYKEGRGMGLVEDELYREMKKDVLLGLQKVPSSWYWHDDYEADDVLGSLVSMLRRDCEGDEVWVISSDRDLWGLVGDKVLCIGNKSERFGEEEVRGLLGVCPSKVSLYKAFFGDKSDNIPRIPRVREKVILGLLCDSETVEEVYDKIYVGGFGLTLKEERRFFEFRDQALINFRVASLERGLSVRGLNFVGDREGLLSYLTERGCPSLLKGVGLYFGEV